MTDNIEMAFNGRKIELPLDLNELLSQFSSQLVKQEEARPRPQPAPQKQVRHLVEQVVICKDMALRNVVIEMNQRLNKLEELLKQKTPAKKIISKTKGKSKAKPKVKIKSLVKSKSIPKKKGFKLNGKSKR